MLLATLLSVAAAYGQAVVGVVGVQPSNPTSVDRIVVDVLVPYADLPLQSVEIVGNEVRLTYRGYATLPASGRTLVPIGPLPAGTYSIVVRLIVDDEAGNPVTDVVLPSFTLVVTAALLVPTLDEIALLILALALSGAGVFIMRR